MFPLLCFILAILASPFKARSRIEAENAALRHQLIVLRRKVRGRVPLTNNDRWFFIQLYRWFPSILQVLTIIRPETLVRWHRAGFRGYWRWKSRSQGGRPRIDTDLRALIRRMSIENPLWGAPRIHGELLKLGFEVAQSSVAKYMVQRRGPPSQGWRTFLRNHAPDIAAMDLFIVPTIGFDLLYAFVIVRLDRRDLVWINVTANPTAEWIARQITEAFPWDDAPQYLIRDRDQIYGSVVTRRLRAMGIRDRPTAPASPWQNGFAERLIGSIRRECVDHFVVLGEAHLRRILRSYARYYNDIRTHRSLDKDAPVSRAVQRTGVICSHAILGGLHHQYVRVFGTHSIDIGQGSSRSANALILKEAERLIGLREGEKITQTPAIEAILRAQQASALRGNAYSLKHSIERYDWAEREKRQQIMNEIDIWEAYVAEQRQAIEFAKAGGRAPPTSLPHPDDVIIDYEKGVRFLGPVNREQLIDLEKVLRVRDLLIMQDALDRKLWTRDFSEDPLDGPGTAFIFADFINRKVPERFRLCQVRFMMHMDRCRVTPKRVLLKQVYRAWRALVGLDARRGATMPPLRFAKQVMEQINAGLEKDVASDAA